MTNDVSKCLEVLKVIARHTSANPIKAVHIVESLGGLVTPREIAEYVELATSKGYRICSGSMGYFYAVTDEEYRAHLRKERVRGINCIKKAVSAQRNIFNHPSLFDAA